MPLVVESVVVPLAAIVWKPPPSPKSTAVTVAPSAPGTSFASRFVPLVTPSVSITVNAGPEIAVGTSSTMLTVIVPVAVLPLASVTR